MFYLTQPIDYLLSTAKSCFRISSTQDVLKLLLILGCMFLAFDVFAQTTIDLSKTLEDTKKAAFGVMDWAFIIVIAAVFLIGAVGISFALVKVFSGKASEGVTALIVGIVCIVLAASLIAVFYTYYQQAVK